MRSRKIALTSVLISLGIAIHVLESFVPFPFPNGRWGFSNLVVLLSIVIFGTRQGLMVALGKSLVGSLLVGHFLDVAFFMSVFGSIAAALTEAFAFKMKIFGLLGVSVLGSAANNFVQACVGALFVQSKVIFWILPYMLVLGLPGAFANAYIVGRVISHVQKIGFGVFITEEAEDTENALSKLRSDHSTDRRKPWQRCHRDS